MVLVKEGTRSEVVGVVDSPYLPELGRTRLARELIGGRFQPRESVQLRKIAVEYELDDESVLKAFTEFQALGMVRLSGDRSAIVRSAQPQETQEAYKIWASIEEMAGRIAASVLKGYTGELRDGLAAMREAVACGDLEECAEYDVKFHRDIVKASQNDVLLRVWDALAIDLRIWATVRRVSKNVSEVVESHQPIIEALDEGLGEEAGHLLRKHAERFLEYLRRTEADQGWADGYGTRNRPARTYRGGLGPARMRKVEELVDAKIDDELSLDEMAEAVGLSTAHFSQMFRKSTGESPHRFVLRRRVERAKELLRAAEARILDVAVACGFKTQQHFARVFRQMCGSSPREYREEWSSSSPRG
jgi:DNA-binding GntR family transcriptional regulator/methylphosphotriester-DNA--protein-cysteine methyltransferase